MLSPPSEREAQLRGTGVEPVAIVLHPQQPLSHLERFIQSELPPIKGDPERHPRVTFMALRHDDTFIRPRHVIYEGPDMEMREAEFGDKDGAGVQKAKDSSYSRRGLVRWAQSTEIGDFIKDVSQVREFVMAIDSADGQQRIHVEVPSFSERTYFLRMRLRKLSKRIQSIAEVKQECDAVAHRGAQRVAIGGFGVLASWWYIVYRITFETDLGWDTMEPVTYLASLSTLMGGYLWFLYHNREISYRSALDITVSARQRKLYQMKGVDPSVWATLIDEGNALRREIKNIAAEYEVEWDERGDEQDERVTEALKRERLHKNGTKHGSKDDDEDNE